MIRIYGKPSMGSIRFS
ncbi:unnamed protein product, partial [Allacma fusca]